jgi:RNA polymerase sigma-70 factor (ECF subfamily)
MVHGIVLSRIDRVDVDDVVQDVFMMALARLGDLREPAAFGGWLAAIARHRAADQGRRAVATDPLPEDMATTREPQRVEALAILDAVRSLPDAYRETLTLRLVEGMTGAEIAERTGLTAASVRVNLHRGMKLLREKLK